MRVRGFARIYVRSAAEMLGMFRVSPKRPIIRMFCKEVQKPHANSSPYEILGVPFGSSEHDIKKAYVALVKRYHPDLKTTTEDEHYLFELINQAYSTLKDPTKKEEIDIQIKARIKQQETVFARAAQRESMKSSYNYKQADATSSEKKTAMEQEEEFLRHQTLRYRRTRPVDDPTPNKEALRQLWLNYALYFSIVLCFIIGLFWIKISINREGLLEVYDQSVGVRYYLDKQRVEEQQKLEMQRYADRLRKKLED